MQDNISPEERLLRLIRKGRNKRPAQKQEKITKKRPRKGLSFNLVSRVLRGILLILGIYLLFDFIFNSSNRIEERIIKLNEVGGAALEIPLETVAQVKPVSYYTQSVKSRNLFTAAGPQTGPARPSSSFMEMVSKLKLQGIVSGPNPQAIIEDSKTKQVYFLSPGEYIGEIELKQILPGKVQLNYYGQEAELSL